MARSAIAPAEAMPEQPVRATPLPTPAVLRDEVPVSPLTAQRIAAQRETIREILAGRDDRLLVICGPCSIHDPEAARDYAARLAALAGEVGDQLYLVMRVYVEKPRTTVGWKGLLHDPDMDTSGDLAKGLSLSRELMRDIADMGLPVATELLSPAATSYLADTLAWAAIGARTTESQTHRERMSDLALPVGFKNATSGDIQPACDAMAAASAPQCYLGQDSAGAPAMIRSMGNPDTHLILRGGTHGPNCGREHVADALARLAAAGHTERLIVDCSHANSAKIAARQPAVLADLVARRCAGEAGIAGVMLESHLVHGKQSIGGAMTYGQSVTDDCLGFAATADALREAAAGLRAQPAGVSSMSSPASASRPRASS
ncbi:MAG: 3-deoxy-7-phosphoheptulonate synthase [Xanthomonadales bacterium]|nr:3-deoxy-7-phosphoheptulonate synthase [Xanthomonadales bacterium]